ncbi:uncharacterized protein UTRI_10195 [Ustilago trichophora]|uniref:Uncharacterized protein n=1 Tax=Ustilago trichophora TaxID=86804 RepID=A0A5C3EG54_9BASI|nr:uncharacterized protein UTRI_10195 [Ustilago trichophora]
MGTKMKRFFARFAIVMALVSLASAAPIPAGEVLGASGSVAGEYTGNIPSVETGAPVPPRKRFRFASPIATYSDPPKTAWTQDSIERIFEPPPKKIRLTLSDEASGGVEQRSTAAIPSGGEITAALPKKSILKA